MGDRVDGEDIRSVSPFVMMRASIVDVAICHIMYPYLSSLAGHNSEIRRSFTATSRRLHVITSGSFRQYQYRSGASFIVIVIVRITRHSFSKFSRLERAKHHDTVAQVLT